MNKKAFVLTMILLSLPLMACVPVQAGKGQDKLTLEINITQLFEPIGERVIICKPFWEIPPLFGGDANVVFVEIEYTASALSVLVGTDTLVPSDVTLQYGVTDTAVYWNGPNPGSRISEKDEFTLDFSELFDTDAKIEIRRIAKQDDSLGTATGTFVGHGTGFLKGVKVSGIQTSESGAITGQTLQLTGTVMGWPTAP